MDKNKKQKDEKEMTAAKTNDGGRKTRKIAGSESEGGSRQGNAGHERSGDKGMGSRQGG